MTTYARWLFGTAAAFNVAVGLALIFGRGSVGSMLGLTQIEGADLVIANLAGVLVLLFGGLYALAAREPQRLRPAIALAAVGKLLAFACVLIPYLRGEISPMLPMLGAGDLVYAILFADYLRRA